LKKSHVLSVILITMEFRQLEILIALSQSGSFTKASESLHLSQSSVSMGLMSLEKETGCVLIKRNTHSFSMTEEGKRLCKYAKEMIGIREKALHEIKERSDTLTISTSSVPSEVIIPRLISSFSKKHPEAKFELSEKDSDDVVKDILNDHSDVGFTGAKASNGLEYKVVGIDTLILAVGMNSSLGDITREDISSLPFIMRKSTSGTFRTSERIFSLLGIDESKLNIAARADTLELQLSLVEGGLGVSVLSLGSINGRKIKALPFSSFGLRVEDYTRPLYMVYKKGIKRNELSLKLMEEASLL